ncbi:MAG TPA: hypothetical protein VLD19_14100, partial [Chitinophagaceae bacterium]|nr:hypothetical protein [Chitinophagaceae bacterium]
NNDCVLNFDARLLNMASLKATIVLQLKDPQGRFTVKGSLGGFDGPRLNVLLRPMALAQVEKGHINKLDFSLACDNYKSHGKVMLLYDDLNISVWKKDKKEHDLKEKKLASLVANMVVKNANPSKKDKGPREATVDYKRDTVRSFFNLIWKSVLTGIKENVGM